MRRKATATRRKAEAPSEPRHRSTPILQLEDSDELLGKDYGIARSAGRGAFRLTAGDVDADAERAEAIGEEAVGGSVATPDQDVVDELARALGVEQDDEEEFRTSGEILGRRDRYRWHLERDAEDEAVGHPHHRRGGV